MMVTAALMQLVLAQLYRGLPKELSEKNILSSAPQLLLMQALGAIGV